MRFLIGWGPRSSMRSMNLRRSLEGIATLPHSTLFWKILSLSVLLCFSYTFPRYAEAGFVSAVSVKVSVWICVVQLSGSYVCRSLYRDAPGSDVTFVKQREWLLHCTSLYWFWVLQEYLRHYWFVSCAVTSIKNVFQLCCMVMLAFFLKKVVCAHICKYMIIMINLHIEYICIFISIRLCVYNVCIYIYVCVCSIQYVYTTHTNTHSGQSANHSHWLWNWVR